MEQEWKTAQRWANVQRPYSAQQVCRLRGSVKIAHTLAQIGAVKLWNMLHAQDTIHTAAAPFVAALGAVTGGQAVQQVKAGLRAIYLSGWQVAADANTSGETYPDLSLYPIDAMPALCRRVNRALLRADHIQTLAMDVDKSWTDYLVPIVADAEAGFGGPLHTFELVKALIEAGAAAVHLEDRLAADVLDVPTVIIARTDAQAASLLTADSDPNDHAFLTGERTSDGFYRIRNGLDLAVARALAYAPYADVLWCETDKPDLTFAAAFAKAVHAQFPGKALAYNCSPSFRWRKHLDDDELGEFQLRLATLGYTFQFVTLAGVHTAWFSMFQLARAYRTEGMRAYADMVQEPELQARADGYTFSAHQQEVGSAYFDEITRIVSEDVQSSLTSLPGSTERADFS
ncbi:isocitrate lyase [bacterium]|nr:isocitrate lyase [bacterium]